MRTIQIGNRSYTEEQIINIIESWKIIEAEGKVKVTARTANFYDGGEDGKPRFLVNLSACTTYGLNKAYELAEQAIAASDEDAPELWQEALNQCATATVFCKDGTQEPNGYLPKVGNGVSELVICYFAPFTVKSGDLAGTEALGPKANSLAEIPFMEVKTEEAKKVFAGAKTK